MSKIQNKKDSGFIMVAARADRDKFIKLKKFSKTIGVPIADIFGTLVDSVLVDAAIMADAVQEKTIQDRVLHFRRQYEKR